MARNRKKADTETGDTAGTPPETDVTPATATATKEAAPQTPSTETSPSEGNGSEEGARNEPAFAVGPIASDRDHAVACAVWANEVHLQDGRSFTVYNVTVDSRWFDPKAVGEDGTRGQWKSVKGFRGSQLPILLWCLRKCEDFILAARDPHSCPF